MTAGITISADLPPLPLEVVTRAIALLGIRGSGKTYAAAVLAEAFIEAGVPVVVLDPIGVWWGLRSSADGQSAGLPVAIFGGDHGDLELHDGSGEQIADILIERRCSAVLDLSLFRKAASKRFAEAFLERLYSKNRRSMHLIVDEADHFAPQRPLPGEQRLLGAMEDIVRRGRARGIGCSLATQRPQAVHKDVLTQCEVLLALRVSHPRDIAAIEEWVDVRADVEQLKAVRADLPSLPTGTGFLWWPGSDLLKKIRVRARKTFDSSATPKPGEERVEPKQLAPVDIEAIRAALAPKEADEGEDVADTLEASRVVRRLQARIAELEVQLAEPRPLLDEATRAELLTTISQATTVTAALSNATTLAESVRRLADVLEATVRGAQPVISVEHEPVLYGPGTHLREIDPPAPPMPTTRGAAAVSPGARRMLVALATFHPKPLTRAQLATLAQFSPKGGGFRNVLSELATHRPALIEKQGESVRATQDGLRIAGRVQRPTSTAELVETWMAKLGTGAQRMLGVLVHAYPGWVTRSGLAMNVAMEVGGGGFRNCLSELSTNGLIEKRGKELRASEAFFIGARR